MQRRKSRTSLKFNKMESSGPFNSTVKVKEESNDMYYDKNGDSETSDQAFDVKNVQYLRCLQEISIHTLEEYQGIYEFLPNQEIKVEFECKDVKPRETLLELNEVIEGIHEFQSNQIKTEVECKEEKPNVNLLVSDETNEGIHQFQPKNEIEIEFECKDFEPIVNLSVPDEENDWFHRSDQYKDVKNSSIKIETEGKVKKEFLSDTQKTIDIKTGCTLNGQNEKVYTLVNKSKQSAECDASLKTLSAKIPVQTDINSEDNSKSYSCDICKKTFKHKPYLNVHIGSVHYGRKPHKCDICGKSFAQKVNLKAHVNAIHERIAYPCDICEKTFSRKYYLKIHIDSFHNGRKYRCDMCEKSFTQISSLKIHIDAIHNFITYPCHVCEKTFSSKIRLKVHMNSNHTENRNPPKCDTCGKSFVYRTSLKTHIDSVHNGITHTCGICGKPFTQKGHLKLHINSVHGH
ncbi:zinc finger protein 227-like [Trichogramma pretiosum]|uniref:zinc finger protein 227-like n=1 Tax=Trichogramma pretiosum TaxID=7493 RepID=UPI0006C9A8B1|nr:zinc finger protein 227-like [Trichogramma pretiosum]